MNAQDTHRYGPPPLSHAAWPPPQPPPPPSAGGDVGPAPARRPTGGRRSVPIAVVIAAVLLAISAGYAAMHRNSTSGPFAVVPSTAPANAAPTAPAATSPATGSN